MHSVWYFSTIITIIRIAIILRIIKFGAGAHPDRAKRGD